MNENINASKEISLGAAHTFIALFCFFMLVCLVGRISSCSGMGVRSLEEHAKIGEAGGKVGPELQKRIIEGARPVLAEIETNRSKIEETSISVNEALKILEGEGGRKALKATGKKYVYFPKMDSYFSAADFPIVAKRYKIGGKDLANETAKVFPYKDTEGRPVVMPTFFGDQLVEAANAAHIPPQFRWGMRDVNLRALMWSRTLIKCQDHPFKYKGIFGVAAPCEKKIKREVTKPDTPGFGHMFAADIENWAQIKDQLAERGFVVGCSSILSDDKRHCSWTVDPQTSAFRRAGCEGSQFLKKLFR